MIWYLKICVCESEYVYQTSTRAVWRPPRRETLIYVNMWILKLQFPILHLNINCHRHRHHHFSWVSSQGTWRPSRTSVPPAPSWNPLSATQAAFSLQHNCHHDHDDDNHDGDHHNDDYRDDDSDDETMERENNNMLQGSLLVGCKNLFFATKLVVKSNIAVTPVSEWVSDWNSQISEIAIIASLSSL